MNGMRKEREEDMKELRIPIRREEIEGIKEPMIGMRKEGKEDLDVAEVWNEEKREGGLEELRVRI
jgi:hypothetical protein